jgi:hypothetical protein
MAGAPYKVYIVVDREFGDKLAEIEGAPVWIVDTPINKAVVRRLWSEHPQQNHLTGITTFDDFESSSPEDILLGQFDTIDLHHGVYSANRPYTVIEVVGTPLTARVENELSEYGFNKFFASPAGFTAKRTEPIE